MKIVLKKGDLTKIPVDVIVNAANSSLVLLQLKSCANVARNK